MPFRDHSMPNVVSLASRRETRSAFEHAFFEHESRLLQFLRIRLGSDADARDAAQAVFLRLWARRDTLHDGNIVALLFVTARNIATDVARHNTSNARKYRSDQSWEIAEAVADDSPDAARAITARQHLDLILKITDELPPKCRSAFVAYCVQGSSYGEISAEMGVTESMVRKYVLKATAHCARRFDELDGWE